MARRDRRSWGRRALKRTTRGKTGRFFKLQRERFSSGAIASKLGMSLEEVGELFEVMEGEAGSAKETATVGGGG